MRISATALSAVVAAALGVGGCIRPPPAPASEPMWYEASIDGYLQLADALRSHGVMVRPGDSVRQPFLTPPGHFMIVHDEPVLVFEYPSEATRRAESTQIAADASHIGPTEVAWTDAAYVWADGRVIVIYVGHDAFILGVLRDVLGRPVAAGGAVPPAPTET
jgi:hypothetical protein